MAGEATIEERVRSVIVESLDLALSPEGLPGQSDLKEEIGLDSAGILDLIAGIEDEFGIEVDVEQVTIENFSTVAGLVRFVESRVVGAEAASC